MIDAALHRRAELLRQDTVRLCARSAELIVQSVTIARRVAETTCGIRENRASRLASRVRHVWLDTIRALPLTPPKLLEIAAEFGALADGSGAEEVAAAFRQLEFRYRALAAGYDTNQRASHLVH